MDIIAGSGRQILGLFAVFSLLGLTVWKLRGAATPMRLGQSFLKKAMFRRVLNAKGLTRQRAIETVERMALTPQHTLHVLRLRDQEMLVATHPQGCTLLHTKQAHEDSSTAMAHRAGA